MWILQPKIVEEKKKKHRVPRKLAIPKPVKTPKLQNSVAEICLFLDTKEYPMIINGKTRALFQDYAQFEQFYLLRLVTINNLGECCITWCPGKLVRSSGWFPA